MITNGFYKVKSGVHRNVAHMSMTIGNRPVQMYTDADGVLREIRDGEGHPFISADVASALSGLPATAGWVIVPVGEDEPEPEEEVIPLEQVSDGSYQRASGTVTARLMGTLAEVRSYKAIVYEQEKQLGGLREEIARLNMAIQDKDHEIHLLHNDLATLRPETMIVEDDEDQQAAPMIGKGGKLTKARKGAVRVIEGDDDTIGTARSQNPRTGKPRNDTFDDDIQRV